MAFQPKFDSISTKHDDSISASSSLPSSWSEGTGEITSHFEVTKSDDSFWNTTTQPPAETRCSTGGSSSNRGSSSSEALLFLPDYSVGEPIGRCDASLFLADNSVGEPIGRCDASLFLADNSVGESIGRCDNPALAEILAKAAEKVEREEKIAQTAQPAFSEPRCNTVVVSDDVKPLVVKGKTRQPRVFKGGDVRPLTSKRRVVKGDAKPSAVKGYAKPRVVKGDAKPRAVTKPLVVKRDAKPRAVTKPLVVKRDDAKRFVAKRDHPRPIVVRGTVNKPSFGAAPRNGSRDLAVRRHHDSVPRVIAAPSVVGGHYSSELWADKASRVMDVYKSAPKKPPAMKSVRNTASFIKREMQQKEIELHNDIMVKRILNARSVVASTFSRGSQGGGPRK